MREKFSIRLISINEILEVTNWARLEGFSPGMDDISIYRNTDKQYKKEKRILFGGTFSKKKLKISPTILRAKLYETDILQQELFSSLLPVIGIDDEESALKKINQTSKPLAIYLFGGNKKMHNHISKVTSSGTICINDVMLPVLIPNLPFGGVGQSGIGKFHGEEGFRNFSNQKSITFKSFLFDLNLRYPPYQRVKKFLKLILQV